MDGARRISFYVSLLYMNAKLTSAFRAEAGERKMRMVDFIKYFFEHVSFLKTIKAPDMVPSMVEGFRQRNERLGIAIGIFDDIVHEFNVMASTPVVDFHDAFTDHYRKLKTLISA
jgi:hypothetical protein